MTQREAGRRRTVNLAAMGISLAVIGLLVVSVLLAAVGPFSKAANDALTPEAAAGAVLGGCDVRADGRYWQIAAGPIASQFADLLQTAAWEETDPFDPGEPDLVLHFWEECELCLYGDGRALFYDGYAARNEAVTACYRIPEGVAEAALDWLLTNGAPLEAGSAANFRF